MSYCNTVCFCDNFVVTEDLFRNHLKLFTPELCPEITVFKADDLFTFWQACEKENGRECTVPFWAVVWPGAEVLARYILDNPHWVKGKSVLDLGCGGCVAGIAAARAGAQTVTANDIDSNALKIAALNAGLNNVELEFEKRDLLHSCESDFADIILVADLFYSLQQSLSLERFLRKARTAGSQILISDANRPFTPKKNVELMYTGVTGVDPELEGVAEREVAILRII